MAGPRLTLKCSGVFGRAREAGGSDDVTVDLARTQAAKQRRRTARAQP